MRAPIRRPNLLWRLFVLGGVSTMIVLSFDDETWEKWEEKVTDAVPRPAMQALLFGTLGIHVLEAFSVWRRARRNGIPHAGAWFRTTLLYGFPTMRLLTREIRGTTPE